jgi:hypothetical protein
MKISNETLAILKNFSNINQGILFRKGKILKTVSGLRNILAEVEIDEDIPEEFAIGNLNEFLAVISNNEKDNPTYELDGNKNLIIKGRISTTYRLTDASMIVAAPEKSLTMPDAEIVFDLTSEDFDRVMRSARTICSPNVVVESDGTTVYIMTKDVKNDGSHTGKLEICNGLGAKYSMIFKTEYLDKLLPGSYQVNVSSKGLANFKNTKMNTLQYWITTEAGSTYNKE